MPTKLPTPFRLTYQDYLWGKDTNQDGAAALLGESEWEGLSNRDKFSRLTQGFGIYSNDPRWDALAQSLGETDRSRHIRMGTADDWSSDWMVDRDRYVDQDGFRFASSGNESAAYQARNDFGIVQHGWVLPLAAAAIGAFAGAGTAGTAGATGTTPFAGSVASGTATTVGGTAATSGALGTVGTLGSTPGVVPLGTIPVTASAGLGAGGTAAAVGTAGAVSGLARSGGRPTNGNSGTQRTQGSGTENSALRNFNNARRGFSLLNNLSNLGRDGGNNMAGENGGDFMSGLFSLLGLGALGRQAGLWGGGTGTPGGAREVAGQAADRADPWGASGLRDQAQDALTPDRMMMLLGLNPGGRAEMIRNDPRFQFDIQEGTNAINVGDAATGTYRSGNRGYELQQYGQKTAARYQEMYHKQDMESLDMLNRMAGLGSSNPAAAGQMLMGGFSGATSLQNAGLDGLIGQLLSRGGGGNLSGLYNLIGQGAGALGSWFSSLFGGGGGGEGGDGDYSWLADWIGD